MIPKEDGSEQTCLDERLRALGAEGALNLLLNAKNDVLGNPNSSSAKKPIKARGAGTRKRKQPEDSSVGELSVNEQGVKPRPIQVWDC